MQEERGPRKNKGLRPNPDETTRKSATFPSASVLNLSHSRGPRSPPTATPIGSFLPCGTLCQWPLSARYELPALPPPVGTLTVTPAAMTGPAPSGVSIGCRERSAFIKVIPSHTQSKARDGPRERRTEDSGQDFIFYIFTTSMQDVGFLCTILLRPVARI